MDEERGKECVVAVAHVAKPRIKLLKGSKGG